MTFKECFDFAFKRFIAFILSSFFVITLSIYAFLAGPNIEAKYFPVLDNQQLLNYSRTLDTIIFEVEYNKLRDCQLLTNHWYALIGNKTLPLTVYNLKTGTLIPNITYEPGHLISGPFMIKIPDFDESDHIIIKSYLYYSCHPFWNIKEKFIEFEVK